MPAGPLNCAAPMLPSWKPAEPPANNANEPVGAPQHV
jgi:hypothetical protein